MSFQMFLASAMKELLGRTHPHSPMQPGRTTVHRSNSNLCITMCLLSMFSVPVAVAQSNQEWIAYKQKCGLPAGMAYNDWVAAGSKCNSGSISSGAGTAAGGLTPQQQMAMQSAQLGGYMIGQGLHNILFGQPKPLAAPLDPASQQRALAAEQLNSSGIYLLKKNDYAGAINEFQQALNQAPNDANILSNLQLSKQRQKDAVRDTPDTAKTPPGLLQGVSFFTNAIFPHFVTLQRSDHTTLRRRSRRCRSAYSPPSSVDTS